MRILFQGAGAIGIAGAALFTDAHEVAVVSRSAGAQGWAAFPRRVSTIDPTGSDQTRGGHSSLSVTRVAATRRVTVTGWPEAAAAGGWDLIVLTTRPGDLDPAIASAIRDISPAFIATTSQVDGDLERARAEFPGTEVVVFGPAFLSERLEPGAPIDGEREADGRDAAAVREVEPGREVRFWAPAGAPRFLAAGRPSTVRSLARGLGRLVLPVPMDAVLLPPAVFIPFVAELSIRDGNWVALKAHLGRPAKAAGEAVRARLGVPIPVFGPAARVVLDAMERIVPIDVTSYAGRHFARHVGQTRDMLAGWAESADSAHALPELIAELDENGPGHSDARRSA
ncbi:hypothetical protein [Brevibacterium sp. CFH 10365]|uniref:hypothetical protein n=1 Tax=Brevibacterium sp. CFH 10365 TaxID=2585207 RepID=UPI0012660955|nr:hypothetical protein [Brevibacterium sp. CFH 10365]